MTFLDTALALAQGGQAALEANRQRINDLNVYPVPDGDTGSNLADTAANLTDGLAAPGLPADDRPAVATAATRAALMGARGNSGVILSQIVRGFAQSLGSEPGPIDSPALARALRAASDAAYRAVRQPVEGTMLTAVRAMAEAAEEAEPDTPVAELLDRVLERGDRTVEETRGMLKVLSDAGVVDAGAAGLVEYARGAVAGLRGERAPDLPALVAADPPNPHSIHAGESRFRYCTTFLVEGDDVDVVALERLLDDMGDSLLVVGERPTFKVHVHTDDPGAALSAAVAMGTVDRVEIANMQVQAAERSLRLIARTQEPDPATGLVAVVSGEGNAAEFRAAGASALVGGGQSMNPSTQEIAAGIAAAAGEGVIVLPNNGNVILAAEHAAALAERPTRVVPTRSATAGLHAAAKFDPGRSLDENARAMADAVAGHRGGELTRAVRGATVDGLDVEEGWYLGLLDGRAVAAGPIPQDVAAELADRMIGPGTHLALIRGDADAFDVLPFAERLRAGHPGAQVSVSEGGQPLYPLLFSASAEPSGVRTADNTAIVLDSTADIPEPEARHRNWSMVPLIVSFGEESFRDYVDIGPEEFYRRLQASAETPRTAAPSPGAWGEAFDRLSAYERILALPVSARVSASSQSAELAARDADADGERITVLDGESVSAATLVLAEGLQRLLVRGVPENELMMWFDDARRRLQLIFSVDTLEYLQRGGRIGRAQAMVGGILGVRPILTLQDGEVAPLRRVRGARRARAEFERFLLEHIPEGAPAHVAIVHARAPEAAADLRAMVERVRPQAVIDHLCELGAVVGTHGGPGTLGMAVLPGE
jgi:DAK2 domain fusion protein YloV